MYVRTVDPDEAQGAVKAMYDETLAEDGYIPNQVRLFSLNPEAIHAWRQLRDSIRNRMDLRRYELATLAASAAQTRRSHPRTGCWT